jgi:hypothetical protein
LSSLLVPPASFYFATPVVAGGYFFTSLTPPVAAISLPEALLALGVSPPSVLSPPFLGTSFTPIFLMPIPPVALPPAMSLTPLLGAATYDVTPPAAIRSFNDASIGSS